MSKNFVNVQALGKMKKWTQKFKEINTQQKWKKVKKLENDKILWPLKDKN